MDQSAYVPTRTTHNPDTTHAFTHSRHRISLKLLLVGEGNVGKTSILVRFAVCDTAHPLSP